MNNPKRLLAKSYDRATHGDAPPDYALLLQHSRDVAAACKSLTTSSGKTSLLCAGLNHNVFNRFQRALVANGWIQDIGKASSHFQQMVSGETQIIQLLRHETISGMLIWLEPKLRDWLEPLSEVLLITLWGAIGHHRKFDAQTAPQQIGSLVVHVNHEDFAAILQDMSDDLQLDEPPRFERPLTIARSRREPCDLPALESVRGLQEEFAEYEPQFVDESERRLLALVKGFGIAADVAASAVAARDKGNKPYSLTEFVEDSLKVGLNHRDLSMLISSWAWARSSAKC